MAWPPTIPTGTRTNTTVSEDTHPADHNAYKTALEDIRDKIGPVWTAGASYPTVDARYAAYDRTNAYLIAHSTSGVQWAEAADLVLTDDSPVDNTSSLLVAMYLIALSGGGDIVFAPTFGAYYQFSGQRILIPSNIKLTFIGGAGFGAEFYGSGNIDPTDVQAHFAGGIELSSHSGIHFGAGSYIVGSDTTSDGAILVGPSVEGVFLTGLGPKHSAVYRHRSHVDSLIEFAGNSEGDMPQYAIIDNISLSGGDVAYDIVELNYAKHLYIENVNISSGDGAGIYAKVWWDSFVRNVRFDYAATRGHSTLSSSPTVGSASHVRGCVTLVNDSGSNCNNIQLDNITMESIGDCGIFFGGPNSGQRVNKCYVKNVKIEDGVRGNYPLIYLEGVSTCDFQDIDLAVGRNLPGVLVETKALVYITDSLATSFRNVVADLFNITESTTATGANTTTTVPIAKNLNTGHSANQFLGWRAYITSSGGTFKCDETISSYTTNSITLANAPGTATVNGDIVKIYCPHISGIFEVAGTNKGISIEGTKIATQPYHYPMTIGKVNAFGTKGSAIYVSGTVEDFSIEEVQAFYLGEETDADWHAMDSPYGWSSRAFAISNASQTIEPRLGDSFYMKLSGSTATINLGSVKRSFSKPESIDLFLHNIDGTTKTITLTSADGTVYLPSAGATYSTGAIANRTDVLRLTFYPRYSRLENPFWIVEVVGANYSLPIPLTP